MEEAEHRVPVNVELENRLRDVNSDNSGLPPSPRDDRRLIAVQTAPAHSTCDTVEVGGAPVGWKKQGLEGDHEGARKRSRSVEKEREQSAAAMDDPSAAVPRRISSRAVCNACFVSHRKKGILKKASY